MALVVAEARVVDLLDALDDDGRRPLVSRRLHFAMLTRQMAASVAVTVRDGDGRLVLVAGLYPEGEEAEAWFAAGPALKAQLGPALRLWRAFFEETVAEARPLTVRCWIAPGSVAGPRIAAWFGFTAGRTEDSPIGPLVSWTRTFA